MYGFYHCTLVSKCTFYLNELLRKKLFNAFCLFIFLPPPSHSTPMIFFQLLCFFQFFAYLKNYSNKMKLLCTVQQLMRTQIIKYEDKKANACVAKSQIIAFARLVVSIHWNLLIVCQMVMGWSCIHFCAGNHHE